MTFLNRGGTGAASKSYYASLHNRPRHTVALTQFGRPWFEACDLAFVIAARKEYPEEEIRNFKRRGYGKSGPKPVGPDNPYDE